MCPFYTRDGDEGYTGLLGKGRFPKNDLVFEVLGDIDEVNSALGLARSMTQSKDISSIILKIQHDLYNIMVEIAAEPGSSDKFFHTSNEQVLWLETQINLLESTVKVPEEFILPGDSVPGAALDLARTIVRRAERHIVGLIKRADVSNVELLHYLNRLSSLCFVMELYENQVAGNANVTLAKSSH